ncbi:MAG: hypothetical protein BWY93_02281 [Euryarchaeota archaeon ADurb.BinA087]|nr:MAG: hypothetical protein BWY93_02281 [Euryarchaeota archaeon ADurb.BinA087]
MVFSTPAFLQRYSAYLPPRSAPTASARTISLSSFFRKRANASLEKVAGSAGGRRYTSPAMISLSRNRWGLSGWMIVQASLQSTRFPWSNSSITRWNVVFCFPISKQMIRWRPGCDTPSTLPPSRCLRRSIAKGGGNFGGAGMAPTRWARFPISTRSRCRACSCPLSRITIWEEENW